MRSSHKLPSRWRAVRRSALLCLATVGLGVALGVTAWTADHPAGLEPRSAAQETTFSYSAPVSVTATCAPEVACRVSGPESTGRTLARRLSVSLVTAGLLVGAALALHVHRLIPAARNEGGRPMRGYVQRRRLLEQARRDRLVYLGFLEARS